MGRACDPSWQSEFVSEIKPDEGERGPELGLGLLWPRERCECGAYAEDEDNTGKSRAETRERKTDV